MYAAVCLLNAELLHLSDLALHIHSIYALPCPHALAVKGEWRVGAKRAFELFPSGLQRRSTAERKKRFSKLQREAITEAASQAASASATQEASVRSSPQC